jgi:hypothetical protein
MEKAPREPVQAERTASNSIERRLMMIHYFIVIFFGSTQKHEQKVV